MANNNNGLTREQLVSEFIKAASKKQDLTDDERREPYTWTTPEVRKTYKLSRRKARTILRDLVGKGVIYPKQIWRIDDWGFKSHVKGYKLTDEFISEGELDIEESDAENGF